MDGLGLPGSLNESQTTVTIDQQLHLPGRAGREAQPLGPFHRQHRPWSAEAASSTEEFEDSSATEETLKGGCIENNKIENSKYQPHRKDSK